MLEVHELNSLDELASLQETWARLLDQTPGGTYFQSLPWLECYWRFYGPEGPTPENTRLRVLLVESDRQPIGIVPLVVTVESRRIGPVRVLSYPLHGWGSFYGPIGPEPNANLSAALRHIRQTPRDWDLIDLRWIDEQTDHGATPQAFQSAGLKFDSQVWHESAQIELASGWDDYWGNRKPKWRSNVRRCERLLSSQGRLEHVRYRPPPSPFTPSPLHPLTPSPAPSDPRWDLYDACVDLARRSWQGSSTTGTTLSHAAVQDYLRAAHARAASSGAVDLNLLTLDNRPIAFAYNYHYRGWVYGVRSGFDSSAADEGAGNVLMAKMLEDSVRRGDCLIDLGPNYLDCKRYWLTRLQPAYHFTHFHPAGVRAQALRLKRIVKRWLGSTRTHPGEVCRQDVEASIEASRR